MARKRKNQTKKIFTTSDSNDTFISIAILPKMKKYRYHSESGPVLVKRKDGKLFKAVIRRWEVNSTPLRAVKNKIIVYSYVGKTYINDVIEYKDLTK